MWVSGIIFLRFLTLALDGDVWLASQRGRSTPLRYPSDRGLGGSQCRSGRGEEEK